VKVNYLDLIDYLAIAAEVTGLAGVVLWGPLFAHR